MEHNPALHPPHGSHPGSHTGGHKPHTVPVWALFIALLVLTAAEVALFEVWSHYNHLGQPFMPKFAMVILLMVFTLPKAAIVMVYFMHLKFEKQLIVGMALFPFIIVVVGVLIILSDTTALLDRATNRVPGLNQYQLNHGAPGSSHDAPAPGSHAPGNAPGTHAPASSTPPAEDAPAPATH